jgi:L-fucose mutarotase
MLKGIAPCISPDLLKASAGMGHGDEMILTAAQFPDRARKQRPLS